jgi:hypothetical protein
MEDITTTVEDTSKTMSIVAACALVGFAAYGVGTLSQQRRTSIQDSRCEACDQAVQEADGYSEHS